MTPMRPGVDEAAVFNARGRLWRGQVVEHKDIALVVLESQGEAETKLLQEACSPHRPAYFRTGLGHLLEGQEAWGRRAIFHPLSPARWAWGFRLPEEGLRRIALRLLEALVSKPDLASVLQGIEGVALILEGLEIGEELSGDYYEAAIGELVAA